METIELDPTEVPEDHVTVKFAGSNRQPETIALRPGITAADVLRHIGLDTTNYTLSDHENQIIPPNAMIYGLIPEGSLVHVTSVMDAG